MPNKKISIIAGGLILQLLLLASPYLPLIRSAWRYDLRNPQSYFSLQAALIGIEFTIITAIVAILMQIEYAETRLIWQEINAKSPGSIVSAISAHQFYADFLAAMKNAKHTVCISYFAPEPPSVVNTERLGYYRETIKVIKVHKNVNYKRIVRRTDANELWIKSLMQSLKGCPNAHIALLDESATVQEMGNALSVQIIDEDRVWLVSVQSHEQDGQYRDIYVQDKIVADSFSKYHSRLWQNAVVVLKAGVITKEGNALISKHTSKS